jgi:hypothetical protein
MSLMKMKLFSMQLRNLVFLLLLDVSASSILSSSAKHSARRDARLHVVHPVRARGSIIAQPMMFPHHPERSPVVSEEVAEGSHQRDKPSPSEHSARQDAHHSAHGSQGGKKNGLGYSLCLVGAVAFNMSLLYLINHSDSEIVLATWMVLNMTLSIFCALLAYTTLRSIFVDPFADNPHTKMISSMILFLSIYVLNECVLYNLKAPKYVDVLHSGSALGSQFLGFAASFSFADMQYAGVFGESILGNLLVVVLAAVVLAGLAAMARCVHRWVEHLHQAEREHLEDLQWEKDMDLMENEAMAVCMGYLVVQTISFTIRGHHIHPHDTPENVTQAQASTMLACGMLFAFATIAGLYVVSWLARRRGLDGVDMLNFESYAEENIVSLDMRLVMIAQTALGVSMAWCLLLWAEWELYTLGFQGPRSAAGMLIGLGLTLFAFAAIYVLQEIAEHVHARGGVDPEHVVRCLTLALGIVVGFAWERSFHVSLKDLAHALAFGRGAVTENFFTICMSIALILIVTPAWAMYVFPKLRMNKADFHSKYSEKLRKKQSLDDV